MPHFPVVPGDEFVKALKKAGYVWDHTEGSHMILLNSAGHRLSVPRHPELGPGLLRALIAEAGLSRDRFVDLLRK
jgi:predicted RNA binding protein YcfA (HicA-like mRNA interferase family)